MFSKISRYRKLPDVVTTDVKGRTLASKSVRLLPEVSGTFLHTVEEVDRLDHLAFKFYKQPKKWWRIGDANPEYMSPQGLLGKESIVTDRFPLSVEGSSQPPWAELLRELAKIVGVENIQVVDDVQIVPEEHIIDDTPVTVYVESYLRALIITYNRMNVKAKDLVEFIEDVGFTVTQPENIGRVGKKIIIPPDVIG